MVSTDILAFTNSSTLLYKNETYWVPPKFKGDGSLVNYTLNWTPDYLEILVDGVRI
jgi:hypothetical protein